MTQSERAELEAELATLQRKAKARRNKPGYEINVAQLDEKIADIEARLAGSEQP